jgi:hypothetical protein
MDPIALARVTPDLDRELAGAVWAGLRPTAAGYEAVFDRAPDGKRPGRRLALVLRLAPPAWLWLDDAGRDGRGRDYAYRPPEGTRVRAVEAPPLDRHLVVETDTPGGHALCLHAELWAPGNVIVEEKGNRIVWAARTRAAATMRGAIAPDLPYPSPAPGGALDPGAITAGEVEAWLAGVEADRRLLALARRMAGLPRGVLDALAPGLPPVLFAEPFDAPAVAAALRDWAARAFAPGAGRVWGAATAGAAQLMALEPGAGDGWTRTGPSDSWASAARALGRALPEPVDAGALAASRARVRRLERMEAALLGDLERGRDAGAVRARAQALTAFLPRVTRGAARVSLPDPADPARTLDIELDPALKPHENADRLFRRAAKLERALERAPAHLEQVRAELDRARAEQRAIADGGTPAPPPLRAPSASVSSRARRSAAPPPGGGGRGAGGTGAAGRGRGAVPAALEPRRYRTREGWEVWIGKSNQGNDHLTHRLARPEDVWMHVHGAAGSHVVLRRGKGPNEPSKATLVEVAGWAAFFSQARNAGTVPVTVTQKKYVRKPRKSPAGLALVERSKTVFARPTEPPEEARIGGEEGNGNGGGGSGSGGSDGGSGAS